MNYETGTTPADNAPSLDASASRGPWKCEGCGWTNVGYVRECDGCGENVSTAKMSRAALIQSRDAIRDIWAAWDTSRKGGTAFISRTALEQIGEALDA